MENNFVDNYEKLKNFQKVIRNMYLKIIDYEKKNDTNNKEYIAIKEIFRTALELEDKYLDALDLNGVTINELLLIEGETLGNTEEDVFDLESNNIEQVRLFYLLQDLLAEESSGIKNFLEDLNIQNKEKIKSIMNSVYKLSHIAKINEYIEVTSLFLIDKRINELNKIKNPTEEDILKRDFLIEMKYRTIAIRRTYESDYVSHNFSILPIKYLNEIYNNNLDKNETDELEFEYVSNGINDLLNHLQVLTCSNNEKDREIVIERFKLECEALLIILNNKEYTTQLYNNLALEYIYTAKNKFKYIKLVKEIFETAHQYNCRYEEKVKKYQLK